MSSPCAALSAAPLTDVSVLGPPGEAADAASGSDPATQAKEAEVVISVPAQLGALPHHRFAVPTPQSRDIRSTICHWAAIYPLCQRNTSRQVGLPFPSCPRPYINSPRYVIANDLSPSATAAMTRNVELNGLGGTAAEGNEQRAEAAGKVRVNEGDAR